MTNCHTNVKRCMCMDFFISVLKAAVCGYFLLLRCNASTDCNEIWEEHTCFKCESDMRVKIFISLNFKNGGCSVGISRSYERSLI